jgi:hypothetical protein
MMKRPHRDDSIDARGLYLKGSKILAAELDVLDLQITETLSSPIESNARGVDSDAVRNNRSKRTEQLSLPATKIQNDAVLINAQPPRPGRTVKFNAARDFDVGFDVATLAPSPHSLFGAHAQSQLFILLRDRGICARRR